MSRWLPRVVLVGIGLLLAVGPRATAQPQPTGDERPAARREQPPRPAPDQEAAGILQQVYDSLSLARVWMSSSRVKLPADDAPLADQAEDFYRTACQAYKDRDFNRATAMAVAAGDATRGLLSVLHGNTPAPPGLPAPPDMPAPPERGNSPPPRPNAGRQGEPPAPPARGGEAAPAPSAAGTARTPKDMAKEVLRAAYRGLGDAAKTDPGTKASRLFLDASRRAYEQGRKAYDSGDYNQALDLAAGAEAWSHVGEDLKKAANPNRPAPGRGQGAAPAGAPPERP